MEKTVEVETQTILQVCFGEGNGNPLQCSCLEIPRDSGAQWATIYGVTQSRTRLKRQQQHSSNCILNFLLNFISVYVMLYMSRWLCLYFDQLIN